MLQAINLTKHYQSAAGTHVALNALNLTIEAGEVFCLLGANGAGKTRQALFLDEPTSGLDPLASNEFSRLIRSLADNNGVAVLMAAHDLFRAKEVGDRIGIMSGGTLLSVINAKEISHSQLEELYLTMIATAQPRPQHTRRQHENRDFNEHSDKNRQRTPRVATSVSFAAIVLQASWRRDKACLSLYCF